MVEVCGISDVYDTWHSAPFGFQRVVIGGRLLVIFLFSVLFCFFCFFLFLLASPAIERCGWYMIMFVCLLFLFANMNNYLTMYHTNKLFQSIKYTDKEILSLLNTR